MSLQKEVIHENHSEHSDSANDYDEQQDYLCFDADGNLNIQSCGSTIQVSWYICLSSLLCFVVEWSHQITDTIHSAVVGYVCVHHFAQWQK